MIAYLTCTASVMALLLGAGYPTRGTSDSRNPSSAAAGPAGLAASADSADSWSPTTAWQIHYRWGHRAFLDGDYPLAIDLLDRAERSLAPQDDPDGLIAADLFILLGDAHRELAASATASASARRASYERAGICYQLARQALDADQPDATRLYCAATERLADVRWTFATESHGLWSMLSHIGSHSGSRPTLIELYLDCLRHLELTCGDSHPDVMTYRLKIARRLDALTRRLHELHEPDDAELRLERHVLERHLGVVVELLAERDLVLTAKALANSAPAAEHARLDAIPAGSTAQK